MSETEIPEILDVSKENIETVAVENIEDEIVDLTSEKQKPDFVYEKLDKLDTEKKLTKNKFDVRLNIFVDKSKISNSFN